MGAFELQTWYHNCGAYAIINAAHALGDSLDYDTVRTLAGTSRSYGTSRSGIIHALTTLEYKATPYRTKNAQLAWRWAFKWCDTNPLILLVDHYEHYAILSGKMQDRVIVIDSGGWSEYNDMGASAVNRDELLTRWMHRNAFYGIRVSK